MTLGPHDLILDRSPGPSLQLAQEIGETMSQQSPMQSNDGDENSQLVVVSSQPLEATESPGLGGVEESRSMTTAHSSQLPVSGSASLEVAPLEQNEPSRSTQQMVIFDPLADPVPTPPPQHDDQTMLSSSAYPSAGTQYDSSSVSTDLVPYSPPMVEEASMSPPPAMPPNQDQNNTLPTAAHQDLLTYDPAYGDATQAPPQDLLVLEDDDADDDQDVKPEISPRQKRNESDDEDENEGYDGEYHDPRAYFETDEHGGFYDEYGNYYDADGNFYAREDQEHFDDEDGEAREYDGLHVYDPSNPEDGKRKGFLRGLLAPRSRRPRDENSRRRRRLLVRLCCLCCCLIIIALIVLLVLLLKKEDKKAPIVVDDDDYEVPRPYEGIVTTPLDPYQKGDCYFGDNVQPHTINQCECTGAIDIIAEDTLDLYKQIRDDINQRIYDGKWNIPVSSCDPANQALVWIASGNTRDSGDIYQRFVTAVTYIQMNGTTWDLHNGWMSDDSECTWIGLQCDRHYELNNLALDNNNLHGSLPTEILYLTNLNTLSMTRNHLSGTLPRELFGMPKLENVYLYANQLIGSIPSEIGLATNLATFRAEHNLFFGTLTTYIGQATALEELSLGFNEFWRTIPTELGLLTNLRFLNLEENRFSGTFPTELGNLGNLTYFLITTNLMRGTVPTEFANMVSLEEFRLANTGVGGIFPSVLGNLTNLHRLEMGENNFKGTIMTEFGLMTGLGWLALDSNDFTGTIPTELGNLVNMTRLLLTDCLLKGTVPSELGTMTFLESLSLEKNGITGDVPTEVCDLRNYQMKLFVTDCYISRTNTGVNCPVPDCCSFCRRGETGGPPVAAPRSPLASPPSPPLASPPSSPLASPPSSALGSPPSSPPTSAPTLPQ